ncbi:DUF5677 domain-containing protein [Streptomyces fractus]|uniref:DUF5677 domain-containing protein n=1 Tax=Streptomyces fractus TaxID=641806 RepID=UPI003CF2C6FB
MENNLENDRETAVRAEAACRTLVSAGKALVETDPSFCDQDPVTQVLAGWWVYCLRTGEATLNLIRDGFVVQAKPLLRLLVEHELTMALVEQSGREGLLAVGCEGINQAKTLLDAMKSEEWEGLDEVERLLAASDPAGTCEREHTGPRHRSLRGFVRDFNRLAMAMGEETRYDLYRHLSGFDHARMTTAQAYAKVSGSSAIDIAWDSRESGSPETIQTAIAVIVASDIISRRLLGDPLRSQVEDALTTLGLPTTDIAPRLRMP